MKQDELKRSEITLTAEELEQLEIDWQYRIPTAHEIDRVLAQARRALELEERLDAHQAQAALDRRYADETIIMRGAEVFRLRERVKELEAALEKALLRCANETVPGSEIASILEAALKGEKGGGG